MSEKTRFTISNREYSPKISLQFTGENVPDLACI